MDQLGIFVILDVDWVVIVLEHRHQNLLFAPSSAHHPSRYCQQQNRRHDTGSHQDLRDELEGALIEVHQCSQTIEDRGLLQLRFAVVDEQAGAPVERGRGVDDVCLACVIGTGRQSEPAFGERAAQRYLWLSIFDGDEAVVDLPGSGSDGVVEHLQTA